MRSTGWLAASVLAALVSCGPARATEPAPRTPSTVTHDGPPPGAAADPTPATRSPARSRRVWIPALWMRVADHYERVPGRWAPVGENPCSQW